MPTTGFPAKWRIRNEREICFSQSEALPRSEQWYVISTEFLRSFLDVIRDFTIPRRDGNENVKNNNTPALSKPEYDS